MAQKIPVHLFCCANPDSIHGLSGYYFQYLIIKDARLSRVSKYEELKDGTSEVVHTWRFTVQSGEFIFMDDPSDALVMHLGEYDGTELIYHVRMCRDCTEKGLDWHPNVGPAI